MNKLNRFAIALMISFVSLASPAFGQEEATDIKELATSDQIGIAYADLNEVQLPELMKQAIEFKLIENVDAEQVSAGAAMAQSFVEQLTGAGAKRAYCVIRHADLENMTAPLLVLSCEKDTSIKRLHRRVEMLVGLTGNAEIQTSLKGDLVVIGQKEAVELYLKSPADPREDLAAAWKQTDTSGAGVILFGDADSRRVLRELFPRLAEPYENIDGPLIADRIDYLSVSMKLKGKFAAKLTVRARDADAANIVADAHKSFAAYLKKTGGENKELERFEQNMAFALKVASPIIRGVDVEVEGSKVEFDLDRVLQDPKLIVDAIQPVRQAARVAQTKNNVRQILLAMLNYESANKVLPVGPIVDEDGKPLLSWRVRILPYMEQNNLYKKFKLDEPWDSPHNIELLQFVPVTYGSPFPEDDELMSEGKTRFLSPMGEGCASGLKDDLTFRKMKDGSSNTIALLFSTPEAAVEWTKPDDWEINMAAPTKTIVEGNSTRIFGVFDGSVHELLPTVADDLLRAMLTFEGGEVFDWSDATK